MGERERGLPAAGVALNRVPTISDRALHPQDQPRRHPAPPPPDFAST